MWSISLGIASSPPTLIRHLREHITPSVDLANYRALSQKAVPGRTGGGVEQPVLQGVSPSRAGPHDPRRAKRHPYFGDEETAPWRGPLSNVDCTIEYRERFDSPPKAMRSCCQANHGGFTES